LKRETVLPPKGVRLLAVKCAKVALTAADWDVEMSERGSGGGGTGSLARISAAESIEMLMVKCR
jgi:hypothetical protein